MRLQPGQVRDAIISFLSEKGVDGAHIGEIHAAVESKLGQRVAGSSVRSYLNLNAKSLFVREGRGLYRIR